MMTFNQTCKNTFLCKMCMNITAVWAECCLNTQWSCTLTSQDVLAAPCTTERPDGHARIRSGPQSSGRRRSGLIAPVFFYILWSGSSPRGGWAGAVWGFGPAACSAQPRPRSGKLRPDVRVLSGPAGWRSTTTV